AEKAVKLMPAQCALSCEYRGMYLNTLGVAYYRVGKCKAAVDCLHESMNLRSGGDVSDWIPLAMAYSKLGDQKQAMKWYKQAVNDPRILMLPNESFANLQIEAEELLGLRRKNEPKSNERDAVSQ